jgi:predicted dehydrogenase
MPRTTRRTFVKWAAMGAWATRASGSGWADANEGARFYSLVHEQTAPPSVAPNDRIRIATIGMGGQGMADTATALRVPGVELVAVADLYDGRLIRTRELFGSQVMTTRDYREVLARPDVDAVIIATSDHWHAPIAIEAMKAGKDVYCEKPMVHRLDEGHRVIETARQTNRILQVGSQRVSSIVYRKAKEIFASGALGEINLVEAWWNRNSAIGAWQYTIPPDASPRTVDWDRFLGNAPRVAFDPVRFFRWRNYRDYGTGVAGDLFVHLFSGLHFVMGALGPTRVQTTGGLRYWKDGRDVPDVMLGLYDYPATASHPEFTLFLKVNFADGAGENSGFRFVGSEGVMTIGAGVTLMRKPRPKEPGYTIETFPQAVQEAFLKEYREKYPMAGQSLHPSSEETYLPPPRYSDLYDHLAAFIQAVRTRQPVVEDAVFGFRAAGPALLSNVSYFEMRTLGWDPARMVIAEAESTPGKSSTGG